MPPTQQVSVHQLATLLEQQPQMRLIDVRTPLEFQEVHLAEARNVPLDTLAKDSLANNSEDPDQPTYVICKSGGRASRACQLLADSDDALIVHVAGGTDAWVEAGLPVVRGRKTVSLERQVRIAAGTLVLTGVALGWLVHPLGFALSALVGAGLVFAGVTDTCGLGMLLARMPWNSAV